MNDQPFTLPSVAEGAVAQVSKRVERLRTLWRMAPWSILMAAFVWTGGVLFQVFPQTLRVRDQSADNSTDAKLESDVNFRGTIREIEERIKMLPRGVNVAVICKDSIYITSAQIISLAIWSDGRKAIPIDRMDPGVLDEMNRTGVDVAFVLDKEQAWFPPGTERLGNLLFFIQGQGRKR
jgi:hypothetical protein